MTGCAYWVNNYVAAAAAAAAATAAAALWSCEQPQE